MPGLTKRALDAAKPREKDYFVWCVGLPGFGARVHPSGRKVFVAQVRVGRAIRRVKIGPYGPFTVEQARQLAKQIVRASAEGRDPRARSATRGPRSPSPSCATPTWRRRGPGWW